MNIVQLNPQTVTFEDWWERQIHKTGKAICQMKWNAITSEEGYRTKMLDKSTGDYVEVHLKATPEEIFEGQKRQNKEFFKSGEDRKFLRRPQQWLNQGGWMDG